MKLVLVALGLLSLSAVAAADPTFTVLTIPDGGSAAADGISAAISRDGNAIMVPGSWTGNDGTILYNGSGWHLIPNWVGQGVSGDGTRIVGYNENPNTYEYFLWYDGTVDTVKGTIYGGSLTNISANGYLGVGISVNYYAYDEGYQYAIIYQPGATNFQFLPHPPGRVNSWDEAYACNGDGNFIVGWSYTDDGFDGQIPVIWKYGSAYDLPFVSGVSRGAAVAINDQGNIYFAFEGTHVVRFCNGVAQDLGAGSSEGIVGSPETSMSNDGNVLVFHGPAAVEPRGYAIWTPQTGFVDAYNFLVDHGIDFGKYSIYNVYSVSADGTKFGGLVWNPSKTAIEPFIATIDPFLPTLKSFSITASVVGGNSALGTFEFSSTSATSFNAVVSSSDHLVSAAPSIPAKSLTAAFAIQTSGVASETSETVEATVGGVTLSKTIELLPASLTGISASAKIFGGEANSAYLTFNGNTPEKAGSATLSSSDTAVATVPATVALQDNVSKSPFVVTTKAVKAATDVTLSATYEGVKKTQVIVVEPASLEEVVPSPASLVGGDKASITIYTAGSAYTGGLVVDVKSSDSALASVPATGTIAAGKNFVVLPVTTKAVTKDTTITFTATYAGVTKTATLTLTP